MWKKQHFLVIQLSDIGFSSDQEYNAKDEDAVVEGSKIISVPMENGEALRSKELFGTVENIFTEFFHNDSRIVSISIVGSALGHSERYPKDIDILYIYESFKKDDLETLFKINRRISLEAAKFGLDLKPLFKEGPFAVEPNSGKTLLHNLITTRDRWSRESSLLRYSWIHRSRCLIGEDIKKCFPEVYLTREDVLYQKCGIVELHDMLRRKSRRYSEWRDSESGFVKTNSWEKVRGSDLLHLCSYAVLRCASNALRLSGDYFGVGKKMVNIFCSKVAGNADTEILKSCLHLSQASSSAWDTYDPNLLQEEAVSFLKILYDLVKGGYFKKE